MGLQEQELWEIEWYVCRADSIDVEAMAAEHVGQEFWRVPISIGPLFVDSNHWAGDHIRCSKEEAYLVAASPKMLGALNAVSTEARVTSNGDRLIPSHVWDEVQAAIGAALNGSGKDST